MTNRPGRPRAAKRKKGQAVGSGGQGRQALEGRGPTPKAEDRPYHPAGKRKIAREKLEAARGNRPARRNDPQRGYNPSSDQSHSGRRKGKSSADFVNGRNAVLEALRTKIPAYSLYIAQGIEVDDRVREAIKLATNQKLPILEVMRSELERMLDFGEVHQGIALKTKSFEYDHPQDILTYAEKRAEAPLIVALDGVTDPRNLGAIIRSVAAFGGHGVIIPGRRNVGVTPAAWKTSAGAAARLPIASVSNLTQTLVSLKKQGLFVIGLDGDGDMDLHNISLAKEPLVIVIGSEGKGLSRLVTETCDAIVSVPISSRVESLNAGIATSVTLYEVAKLRSQRSAGS